MITKIKDKLKENEEQIIDILEEMQCTHIKVLNNDTIRFGMDEMGSGSGNVININTLSYNSFSRNIKGDIITLVAEIKKTTIGEAIKWLANKLNIKIEYTKNKPVKLPFGAYWLKYKGEKYADDSSPITYSNDRLKDYTDCSNLMWIKDGISAQTQELYSIGYDLITDRITIPWHNEYGELIGVMGRLYTYELNAWQNKYMPLIAFNKGKALYGYYQAYKEILNRGMIIIVESEKSVLKARELGYNNVVALGGNNISRIQQRLITSLYCDCIVALDEGLELKHYAEQAKKLIINNPFYSNEVYFIDMSELEEKSCIFDLDEEIVVDAFENRLIYIE